jgi:hypothetical protein
LAAGGLTYLASLAWHPQLFSPAQQPQMAEADPGTQLANKALTEVGTVRRVVTEIQKDLGRIKDSIGQREAEEKAAQARLTALEERVTTMAATPVAQATPEPAPGPTVTTAKQRASEKKATAEKRQNGTEPPRAPTHIISVTETPTAAPDSNASSCSPKSATMAATSSPRPAKCSPSGGRIPLTCPASGTDSMLLIHGRRPFCRLWTALFAMESLLDTISPRPKPFRPRLRRTRWRDI